MKYRTLVDDLRVRPLLLASEDAFVSRVMESCKLEDGVRSSREIRSRRVLALGVLASVAAVAVVGLGRPRMREQWTARGSTHRETRSVSVQTLVARDHGLLPIDNASLRPGDGIAVRYSNDTGERRFLMVLAVDAAKTVHWIYPAYTDEGTNPTSIALEPNDTARLLDDIVEPDQATDGPLRVVAITSREPLSVKTVEQRLSGGAESVVDLFPEGRVQEWRCLWTSR